MCAGLLQSDRPVPYEATKKSNVILEVQIIQLE
jgi:hypothetical protein